MAKILHGIRCFIDSPATVKAVSNVILLAYMDAALQVCTIEESDADSRKFYVNSGTNSIRLRAETE